MNSDNALPKVKVIFLGNCGVGKTSLIARQINQPFEEHLRSTVAPSTFISPQTLPDGSDVNLVLWDTAGQERYRAITVPHCRDAQVAIICYDPREPYNESLQSVTEWSDLARKHAGKNCKILVVACKIDLFDQKADHDRSQCHDELSRLTAAVLASGGYVTSAKTTEGISGLFAAVASLCPPQVEPMTMVEAESIDRSSCCSAK
jgi:small GTP-binding protein